MKTNLLVCPGDACPLRYTCERFHAWIDTDDADNEMEMEPAYNFQYGLCPSYIQKEFYGQ